MYDEEDVLHETLKVLVDTDYPIDIFHAYAGCIQVRVVGTFECEGGVVTSVSTIDCALSAVRLRRSDQDTK